MDFGGAGGPPNGGAAQVTGGGGSVGSFGGSGIIGFTGSDGKAGVAIALAFGVSLSGSDGINQVINTGSIQATAADAGAAGSSATAYGVWLKSSGTGTNVLDNSGYITAIASGGAAITDAVFGSGSTQFANEQTGYIQGNVVMDNSTNIAQLFAGSQINGNLLAGTNTGSLLILDGDNTVPYGYSAAVSGSTQFGGTLVKQGSGVWILDKDLNQGLTVIYDGFINFNTTGVFGTGNITLDGGGLQWATGYTGDVSGILNPIGADGGILDSNGNSDITLADSISGSGVLEFVNSATSAPSTFTLTATNTWSGGTVIGGTFPGEIHVLAENPGALGSGTAVISSLLALRWRSREPARLVLL